MVNGLIYRLSPHSGCSGPVEAIQPCSCPFVKMSKILCAPPLVLLQTLHGLAYFCDLLHVYLDALNTVFLQKQTCFHAALWKRRREIILLNTLLNQQFYVGLFSVVNFCTFEYITTSRSCILVVYLHWGLIIPTIKFKEICSSIIMLSLFLYVE